MPEAPHPKLHAHPARKAGGEAVLPPPLADRPSYAELYCLSNFSFLRGASHPEELIERAGELGYAALAMTDRNSLAGVVRAHVAAQSWNRQHPGQPLRLIIGAEVTPLDGPPLVLLATDRAAYGRLARLLTRGKRRARKGRCELYLADVAELAEGLVAIAAPRDAEVDAGAAAGPLRHALDTCRGLASRLAGLFLAAPLAYEEQDELRFERLLALSERSGIPLLACNHVHYHVPQRRYLQDVLTCIRSQCTLADAGRRLFANAERHLRPIDDVYRRYGGFADRRLASAGRAAVARTLEVAARCTFGLDELRYDYPSEVVPAGLTAMEYLEQETWAGARAAFAAGSPAASPPAGSAGHPAAASADAATCPACPRGSPGPCRCPIPPDTRVLLTAELDLIRALRYEHYFLTVYDIVQFARARGILCQGRGSAANSAVCYVLGITAVDPTRHDLLFERFISKERNEPPDIDVDFEHERREEVFQYIYEKYGRERAAITAEVISYRPRSAIRDVGKVLGLSLDRLDVLAKSIDWFNGWDRIETPDQDQNHDHDHDQDQNQEAAASPASAASPAARRSPLATLHEQLAGAGLDPGDRTVRMLVRLVRQLLGFPRHLSQHVGGFVITQTPLCEIVPLENGAMPGRTFIEWDKDDIDALGILKVDCLALGMLTALSKCFRILKGLRDLGIKGLREENAAFSSIPQSLNFGNQRLRDLGIKGLREENAAFSLIPQSLNPSISQSIAFSSIPQSLNPSIPQSIAFSLIPQSLNPSIPSLRDLPPEDPVVYDMICAADTIGVFQIESRAQMSMLPRLRPRCFYDLVIEVAIVRPGPIQGGMVHPYLRRRDGLELVSYPSPQVERVLSKTLGVPLFQEQVMRLAVVAAGFTPGEADQLRRAMAAWRRGGSIEKFRRKLIFGMLERGYSKAFAEQIFRQIEGFGEYGFPESHAASFALLVYASAWLKCYHPAAFCAAMLNSFPLGFYTPGQLVRDALAHGVRVLPVDVNASGWDCTLEIESGRPAPALRLGLRLVRGLSADKLSGVVAEQGRGPIRSIRQLARRDDVARDTLIRLAAADAFRSLGLSRRQAFWHILALDDADLPLFDELATPEDPQELPEMSCEETVIQDYDMIGFSLAAHPLGLIRAELDRIGAGPARPARAGTPNGAPAAPIVPNARLRQMKHGARVAVAGLVTVRQRPGTAKGTTFMTLEDETGFANLVVWPKVWEREWRVARSKLALVAEGRIERQGEVIHVMVQRFYDISRLLGPLRDTARNFH